MHTPRARSESVDLALAGVLGVWTQVAIWTNPVEGSPVLMALLWLLVGWPLVVRRTRPLIPAVALAVAVAVQAVITGDAAGGAGLLLTFLVTLYSVGAWGSRTQAWIGLLVLAAAVVISAANDRHIETSAEWWASAFFWLLMVGAWVLGRAASARRTLENARREEAEASQRSQDLVRAERARIARELHDVVAHEVSVMVIQAVGALGVLDTDSERARDPLMRIEASGRDALVELRRLLDVMREVDESGQERTPQPGLADVPALVAGVTSAGVPVDLELCGEPGAIPRAVELSAYRIIQEALTNTIKHAGQARAQVRVDYGREMLDITVTDDGCGTRGAPDSGHGIVGMRERVAMYGGTLEARDRPEGGFRVKAHFPCPQGMA